MAGILYYVFARSIDVEAETRVAEAEAAELEAGSGAARTPLKGDLSGAYAVGEDGVTGSGCRKRAPGEARRLRPEQGQPPVGGGAEQTPQDR